MKTIIKIPIGLSPKEEIREIAKLLNTKLLSGNGKSKQQIAIGDDVNVTELNSLIEIQRIGEKPAEYVKCNICGCEYQSNFFQKVFTNYGGKVKLIKVCSNKCQEDLINTCGEGRAAKTKGKLSPTILHFKHN